MIKISYFLRDILWCLLNIRCCAWKLCRTIHLGSLRYWYFWLEILLLSVRVFVSRVHIRRDWFFVSSALSLTLFILVVMIVIHLFSLLNHTVLFCFDHIFNYFIFRLTLFIWTNSWIDIISHYIFRATLLTNPLFLFYSIFFFRLLSLYLWLKEFVFWQFFYQRCNVSIVVS